LYVHEYSFTNLSGHFLKIISTFFIYKAIVEKGLMDPYNLLFRKLSESEELWRSITNSSPDHIMILDKELNIQFVNYASPGMAIEDLIGTPLYNYVPEEKQNEVRVILEGVLHTLKDARYETTYTSPEGSTINYESRATPRMISGSVVGLTVAARDITNRKKADEAIQHERDKLTNILDSMEDGIYIVNQDFDIEYINPVLKKDFGHVEGRKCYIYFHGLKEVCQWCKNKEVFKGKTVRWECFSDKTGKTYDLLDTPLKNPDGSLSKLELLRDITNHKKIEEELLSKQHLNQLLIDSLPYPAMLISKDRKVLAANLKAKEAGAKPGKYCWQSFGHTEFIPEKDKQFIAEHNKVPAHCIQCHFCMADESMQGRSHLNVDVLAWDRVWDTHWIPLDNTTYLHYAIDITERRQAEEELLRHREHLVDLVEERTHELKTSYQKLEKEFAVRKATEKKIGLMALFAELNPAPVMRINTIGEVIMANAAAIEILNINLQKTVTLSSILPGADRLDIQSCISNSTTLSLLTKIKDHYYHFIIRGISDLAMGQIYGTDITDQKKAEAETVQASQLALTGELAAGVAHEVNNPINGIINYSQILANRSSTKSEEHRIALLIIKESNRIANIVKELLAFTRTNNEDKRPAHIHEIMNDSLGLIKTHLENKGTTLKVNIPSSLPRVLANPQHLEQVFLNIINNAGYALNQKHTFSNNDKVLEISAEEIVTDNDNYILITFHDKGIGISKELLNNITEPFFTTKPGGKGTGLGLSISKSIISDHGGSLSIESTEGEFTRVTIKLPAATQHNENKPGTNLHNFSKGPK
jgi:PAS domain S-box-containing protein